MELLLAKKMLKFSVLDRLMKINQSISKNVNKTKNNDENKKVKTFLSSLIIFPDNIYK